MSDRQASAGRRVRARVVIPVAAVVVAAAAVLVGGSDDRRTTEALGAATTSTVAAPSTSTTTVAPAIEVLDEAVVVPTTVAASTPPTETVPPAPTAPPTTRTCRNSREASCGPWSWDPRPVDRAPTATPGPVPAVVSVGEEVRFAVVVEDPDGGEGQRPTSAWSFPGLSIDADGPVDARCDRHGPQDPPAPTPDRFELATTWTFDEPGTHVVEARGTTNQLLDDGCENPYASTWSATWTVVVEGADDGSGGDGSGDDGEPEAEGSTTTAPSGG